MSRFEERLTCDWLWVLAVCHCGPFKQMVPSMSAGGYAVVRAPEFTRLPRPRAGVEGVINLSGRVLPVVDLPARLALGVTACARSARVVVVEGGSRTPDHAPSR